LKQKKRNDLRIIIFVVITLVLVLIILLGILNVAKKTIETDEDINVSIDKEPNSIKEIIEKHESIYIKEEGISVLSIYVNFKYDLYDEKGNSNKRFFDRIVDEIAEFRKASFNLIDEKKNIRIEVRFNVEGNYTVKINEEEDYYEKIYGDAYVELQETKRAEEQPMTVEAIELNNLIQRGMYFAGAKLGDKIDLSEGYSLYKDGTIKTRNEKGMVKNIIFLEGYKEKVVLDVLVETPLEKINEIYKKVAFGSVRDGYLGYINNYIYIFFYEDEISAYGYSYRENPVFERNLEEYLNDEDLSKFAESVRLNWMSFYDTYEYDEEQQNLYITIPILGVEINIENNNPKGIILYSNYYFTDKTRRYIKDGFITVNIEDYIHVIEKERRGI